MTRPSRSHRPTASATEATLALTALTAAVAVGMGRLFEGTAHLVPLLTAAFVGHGVMWVGRRRGVALALAAAVAVAGCALAAVWLLFAETTTLGMPTAATLSAAREALAGAWREFGDVVAPAHPSDGFLVSGMAGVVATAVLADWAAFRMRACFEALVPSFTLFVFSAMLGTTERRGLMVGVYLAALLVFLAVHHASSEAESTSWFASRSKGGPRAVLRGAAVLGAVAVVGAVVVGPRLPGASADAVLAWRDSDRAGNDARRTTVSPLVDIRGRLVDQSSTEVFSVRSDQRAYWRLTSLDTFDGRIWSSDSSYRPVGRRLPGKSDGAPAADRVVQEFTIGALSSIWLPAAYRPEAVDGIEDVSYSADLGSLITEHQTTDGLTYTVESAIPRLTAHDFATPSARGAPEGMDRFLRFPRLSSAVTSEAASIAASSDGTPYGKALALQSYFREGFTYDLGARPGHDARALESFLLRTRRGYCEQFAGAFAVLARAMGLPTRVAVGFTPGEMGSDGRLHVRGLNAHAWPEVFLAGVGWVAFEPTPGRGAPGAENYLGVSEAQARPDNPTTATTAAPTTTVAGTSTTTPPTTSPAAAEDGNGTEDAHPLHRRPAVIGAGAVMLAFLLVGGAIPLAKSARRRRRWAGAATPADRVWVAWREAADAIARAGAPRRPEETLAEHALRAGHAAALTPDAAAALGILAADAGAASYAPGSLPDETAQRAAVHAATVERHVTAAASKRQRLLWTLDPRPLLPGGTDRRR